jgi:DNA-binding MarR family transcriptional regulator
MSENAENRIVTGVIDSALEAVRSANQATKIAEQQIEAFATYLRFSPSAEDLSKAPSVTVKDMIAMLAVARLTNITNAAHELGLAQPALSRQIKRIEEIYGFDLFDRSTKSMSITPQGTLVLEAFTESLNLLVRSAEAGRQLD